MLGFIENIITNFLIWIDLPSEWLPLDSVSTFWMSSLSNISVSGIGDALVLNMKSPTNPVKITVLSIILYLRFNYYLSVFFEWMCTDYIVYKNQSLFNISPEFLHFWLRAFGIMGHVYLSLHLLFWNSKMIYDFWMNEEMHRVFYAF